MTYAWHVWHDICMTWQYVLSRETSTEPGTILLIFWQNLLFSKSESLPQQVMSTLIENRCLFEGNIPAQVNTTKLKAATGLKLLCLWFFSTQLNHSTLSLLELGAFGNGKGWSRHSFNSSCLMFWLLRRTGWCSDGIRVYPYSQWAKIGFWFLGWPRAEFTLKKKQSNNQIEKNVLFTFFFFLIAGNKTFP